MRLIFLGVAGPPGTRPGLRFTLRLIDANFARAHWLCLTTGSALDETQLRSRHTLHPLHPNFVPSVSDIAVMMCLPAIWMRSLHQFPCNDGLESADSLYIGLFAGDLSPIIRSSSNHHVSYKSCTTPSAMAPSHYRSCLHAPNPVAWSISCRYFPTPLDMLS